MPDKDGKLVPRERDQIDAWLKARCPGVKCPVCATHSWVAGEHLIRGDLILGNNLGVWMFPLVCNQCANTLFFNVHLMGIVFEWPKWEGLQYGISTAAEGGPPG